MNLLKANWEGKVGQTVGAKWKNKSTIRSYTKPSNPDTAAQQKVRGVFGSMTSFVALFADQIKYLSALNTAGQSVRNAIIQANKTQIDTGTFDKSTLLISKGGLQKVAGETGTAAAGVVTVNWTSPTATNFTENAKLIVVLVQSSSGLVEVIETEAKPTGSPSVTGSIVFASGTVDAYVYFLDKRGSNKVASISDYLSITVA
jgi:hypothetical protein